MNNTKMNNKRTICRAAALAIAAAVTASVAHADLRSAKRVFESGNWTVLRDKDGMTDKIDCTGIYKSNNGIQLTQESLYITVRGGIQSVNLRFGDNPARAMRLPTEVEKKIGVIVIDRSDFSELLGVNRLRVQSLTLVRNMFEADLDLAGLTAAHENIKAGCPEPEKASAPAAPKANEPAAECSPGAMARMKARGVQDKAIAEICAKS
jgi:hypothetical protein